MGTREEDKQLVAPVLGRAGTWPGVLALPSVGKLRHAARCCWRAWV